MKILAIHNYYQIRSGEDLAFDATIATLRAKAHEIHSLTQDNQSFQGPNRPWIAKLLKTLALPFSAIFSLSFFFKTLRACRSFRPDVALVQNVFPLVSPSVYLALKISGIPVAQRIFNYRLVCPNGILYTQGRICERCTKGAYWNAVRYQCYRNSRAASAVLALSLGLWRALGVWSWGVSLFLTPDDFLGTKIVPATGDSTRFRKVFNPAPESSRAPHQANLTRDQTILYIGRLVRPKGILTLLEVARLSPLLQFVIIGKGEDETLARETARKLGLSNITWAGAVYGSELENRLSKAGALILPSEWYDNMPLVLTQALLNGIPVVASRINGIPEFVQDGITGRLAEPGNASDFASRLAEVFSQLDKTMAMAAEGVRRARKWFMPETNSIMLENALRELVKGDEKCS